jgi:hypothetical protein
MVPNSLDKIQTSTFLQELKHICSKEATILKINLILPTQQSSILKSFTKSKRVTMMMQTKKLQHNQFSRSISIAP